MAKKPIQPKPFHVQLKNWRERQGITQAEASTRCGVNYKTYCNWEQGRTTPITAMMNFILGAK